MIFDFLFKKKNKQIEKRKLSKPSKKKSKKTSKKTSKIKSHLKETARKAPPRSKPAKAKKASKVKEVLVGNITHFFSKANAGVVKLKASLKLRDTIHIKGHTTDFIQEINSLQIDNKPIKSASRGKLAGFLSAQRVRTGDKVYKIAKP